MNSHRVKFWGIKSSINGKIIVIKWNPILDINSCSQTYKRNEGIITIMNIPY